MDVLIVVWERCFGGGCSWSRSLFDGFCGDQEMAGRLEKREISNLHVPSLVCPSSCVLLRVSVSVAYGKFQMDGNEEHEHCSHSAAIDVEYYSRQRIDHTRRN